MACLGRADIKLHYITAVDQMPSREWVSKWVRYKVTVVRYKIRKPDLTWLNGSSWWFSHVWLLRAENKPMLKQSSLKDGLNATWSKKSKMKPLFHIWCITVTRYSLTDHYHAQCGTVEHLLPTSRTELILTVQGSPQEDVRVCPSEGFWGLWWQEVLGIWEKSMYDPKDTQ